MFCMLEEFSFRQSFILRSSEETLVKYEMFLWGKKRMVSKVFIKIQAKLELSHWEPGRAFQHLGKSSTEN